MDLANFRISVSRKPVPTNPNSYAVHFFVKGAPGEPGPKLTGTSLGRSYSYFVDKQTFRVKAHHVQE